MAIFTTTNTNTFDSQVRKISLPSWVTEHKRWEKPSIGNIVLPGVVHLKRAGISLRHEKGKSEGNDNGQILIQGLDMPSFEFELLLMTKEDEEAWNALVPYLLPRKDPRDRGIFPVSHPSLNRYQIYTCCVTDLEEIPPVAGGPMKVTIKCAAVMPVKEKANKNLKNKGGNASSSQASTPETVRINPNVPSPQKYDKSVKVPTPRL